MGSLLTTALAGLTPPPHINPVEYDGLEYKWSIFVFRPALFQTEVYLLAGLLAYILLITVGISRNSAKVNKWFNAYRPILEQQFSKPLGKTGLTKDGYSDFYNFSTGRRNVMTLHTVFTLKPRHDFLQRFYQLARTFIDLQYRPKDDVTLDFRLSPGALTQDFVWAVVAKDELLSIKDDRWDLTFTKTSENPALPPSLSVMTEFADVTDNLLKPQLIAALNNPKMLPYFRSLSVTDQPRIRPDAPLPASSRQKHVILSLSLPSGNVEDTFDLINAVFSLIDSLSTVNLRPETKTKLKKTRDELDKTLKADAEKEKKEELEQAAEDRKAAKRRAEEERIAKLPAAEQQKVLEKERKRALRKTQGKVVRK
ncbi:putative protein of unknown function (DUF1682) [Lyophyllum shimeji]|uniref:DUF1682-domain-containing protein n=1 Tax=Lyophyllum shimeji TaxID=47721 RepID=A0A9P3PE64_LYOSH|nr:putative protein of unknown function (DUF1682) [Lyophyllum shimeji]